MYKNRVFEFKYLIVISIIYMIIQHSSFPDNAVHIHFPSVMAHIFLPTHSFDS